MTTAAHLRSPDAAERNPGPPHPQRDSRIALRSIRATAAIARSGSDEDFTGRHSGAMRKASNREFEIPGSR